MSEKTSISAALRALEANPIRNPEGQPVDTLQHVKLMCQCPPIYEMDGATLCELKNCERLALSTNCIEKITPIGGMTNLKILSLSRNQIGKIEHLEGVSGTLEQLWLSYNNISSFSGLERLKQLRVLCIANNKVKKWDELDKLTQLPLLAEVVLKGNPFVTECKEGDITYARQVLKTLPHLQKLDGISTAKWRQRIDEYNTTKLKNLFDRIDLDRGGTITANEMGKVLKNDDEMRKILGVQKGKEAELFSEMDEDGGGDISWDEFLLFFGQRLNDF